MRDRANIVARLIAVESTAARVLGVTPRSSIRPPSLRPSIRNPAGLFRIRWGVCFSILRRGDLPRSRSVRRNGLMSDLVETFSVGQLTPFGVFA